MANVIFILGILLLAGEGTPLLVRIMMGGALVVSILGYGNLSSAFATRTRQDYLPARAIRWK